MHRNDRLELFSLSLFNGDGEQALRRLLAPGPLRRVAFVNAHCINVAHRDRAYAEALASADLLLPDGSGISIAARLSGQSLRENLNGTDLFPRLCRAAARECLSIYLLGAAPGVAEAAAEAARRIAPGLRVAGTCDGFAGAGDEEVTVEAINRSGADILLVAMGVPLQDLWIQRNAGRLQVRAALGVGGLFDFFSGRISRAPRWLRAIGQEWTWRLAMEPRRMAGRYLLGNPLFLLRAAAEAVSVRLAALPQGAGAKRALDLAVASGALLALSPLFLGVAAAIRLNSPGPVFFRQQRVGAGGVPFTMLKFRSMYVDAERRRTALLAESDRQGICFKAKKDPRITSVGRFLRRFSIDELPQILNVLLGQMSVVGPRPALPQEVAAYPAEALGRLQLKPGLTGIWQVAGRADIGFEKMIDMDLAYARNRSILLDLALLALTLRAVAGGRGAY